jgi:hypothetical protein
MGGAYTVSKENLGVNGSLLAAAALMVDYVLNVALEYLQVWPPSSPQYQVCTPTRCSCAWPFSLL